MQLIRGFAWAPPIVSLIITVLIVIISAIVYNVKIKKYELGEPTKGFCFVIELFVRWCQRTTVEMGGKRMKWAAPYLAFIIIYISINNLVAILGIANPISQLTVPLALGSVTFLGLFVMAVKYRNRSFWKEYLNPTYFFTQFSPLISISFRLFGNIISGSIIIGLLYGLTNTLWEYIPVLGQINVLGGLLIPPFHFYFDLFQGILQSYIFSVLTISYWASIANEGTVGEETPNKKKNKFFKKNKIKLNKQIEE